MRAVATGTEVGDSLWKELSVGDRCWGSPRRVVVDPRLTDLEGLEGGLFAMILGVHRAFRGRAAFELVGAQVPQRGVQAAGVVPGFQILKDGHASLCLGLERTPVDELAFERGEEALGHRIDAPICQESDLGEDLAFAGGGHECDSAP